MVIEDAAVGALLRSVCLVQLICLDLNGRLTRLAVDV
jgi:hypothetical protein